MLTDRWTTFDVQVPEQQRLWRSKRRFNACHAPRRVGKTEILCKRKVIRMAAAFDRPYRGRMAVVYPTLKQAKRVCWADWVAMAPKHLLLDEPRISELTIPFWNCDLYLASADKPERLEGDWLDHASVDEVGNVKEELLYEHLLPMLSSRGREGSLDILGVPEGLNHYKDEVDKMRDEDPGSVFWWPPEGIIAEEELQRAREKYDELTYRQEWRGEFVSFAGKCAFAWDQALHCKEQLGWQRGQSLRVALDFNVEPGIAALGQTQYHDEHGEIDAWIDEVWIEKNSNTVKVCHAIIDQVPDFMRGETLYLYGDPTGGNRGTAKLSGSDWDIAVRILSGYFDVELCVRRGTFPERIRLNALNSRLRAMEGNIRTLVGNCPELMRDMEGTLSDSKGGIDKKRSGKKRTHLFDAVSYAAEFDYPIVEEYEGSEPLEL